MSYEQIITNLELQIQQQTDVHPDLEWAVENVAAHFRKLIPKEITVSAEPDINESADYNLLIDHGMSALEGVLDRYREEGNIPKADQVEIVTYLEGLQTWVSDTLGTCQGMTSTPPLYLAAYRTKLAYNAYVKVRTSKNFGGDASRIADEFYAALDSLVKAEEATKAPEHAVGDKMGDPYWKCPKCGLHWDDGPREDCPHCGDFVHRRVAHKYGEIEEKQVDA